MARPGRILVVEDEVSLLNSLSFILEREGFEVMGAASGEDGVAVAEAGRPDLLLLDIALPGIDGFEVASRLAHLRAEIPMRILMVTARDVEDDIVRALQTCADDYVVKPVRPRVLLARIHAVLRRAPDGGAGGGDVVRVGGLVVDSGAFEATLDGVRLDLTPTEFRVLLLLARHPNRAFRRHEIIDAVHGEDHAITERCVDFQILGLRRKLGPAGAWISTVRGIGFKLSPA